MKKLLVGAILLVLFGIIVIIGESVVSEAPPSPTPTPVRLSTSQFYTPVPTATPMSLSVKQKITNAIAADEGAVSFCYIVDASTTPAVDIAGQAGTITSNVSSYPRFFTAFTDDRAEECIFSLEQDAWTSDPSAIQVTVHVQILLQDKNRKQFTGDTAWAVLKQDTEQKLVWASLSYTQAWSDYDETWLLPGNA